MRAGTAFVMFTSAFSRPRVGKSRFTVVSMEKCCDLIYICGVPRQKNMIGKYKLRNYHCY